MTPLRSPTFGSPFGGQRPNSVDRLFVGPTGKAQWEPPLNVRKWESADAVEVRFRSREADGAIPGYLDLEFEDGVSIRGGFRAAWRHRPVYCG
jgi:hypothetical protein